MDLLKNLEGLSADEQMSAVVELQKAAMKTLEEQKQASIGKSAELVIQGLKKIKSDFEAKFDSLNYDIQAKVANIQDGQQGLQGPKGEQGDRGLDGYQGKDGVSGVDGKDGLDGEDGVSVQNAKIDFDGSLVITLSDGKEINVGEVVPVDVAQTIHRIQSGSGGDSQTTLNAIAALQATIATYGTMATQNANNVAITGGTINNTTVGATTPSTGVFTTLTATGQTSLGGVAGSEGLRILTPTLAGNYAQINTNNFGDVIYGNAGSGTNIPNIFLTKGTGIHKFATNNSVSNTQAQVSHTASAVNFVQVTGAATGSSGGVAISAQGSDADVNLRVVPKGAGYFYVRQDSTASTGILLQNRSSTGSPEMGIRFISGPVDLSDSRYAEISSTGGGSNTLIFKTGNGSSPQEFLRIAANGDMTLGGSNTAPNFKIVRNGIAINFLQVTGAVTGTGPVLSAQGTDTNIPVVLQPKGTGALQAQQTDSTATGGNARGANAVDWQTSRGGASNVASGGNSFIGSGNSNSVTSSLSGCVAGDLNFVSGYSSFIGAGNSNIASNVYSSVTTGLSNVASGFHTTVVNGSGNTAAGLYNFIGNGQSNSATSGSAVTTQSATMNATTAVTLSASNANIKVGQYIVGTSIAGNTYVSAISGTSLTLSKVASGSSTSTLSFFTPHGIVVGGGNNQATGSYSFIGGGGDAGTAANRNVASGDWGTIGGGRKNVASGIGSTVAGGGTDGTNVFANTASGTVSFIGGGFNNNATGTYAQILGGATNTASGYISSVSGGSNSTANGDYSAIIGGTAGTTRSIAGNIVAGNLTIGSPTGASQFASVILGRQTTDATSTVLTSNQSAASTTNQVILPNNSAYTFRGEVVSGVTGGGNSKSWTIEGLIKRGANAASTTLVGSTVTSMYADVGAATWVIALSADTTNGGLAVTFTGQAATTIRTVCQIRTTEMTY